MNKQIVFYVIAGLAGIGLIGVGILAVFRPDATATMWNYLLTLLGILAVYGGLSKQQADQGKVIETIKRNTNGTLSEERAENARLRGLLATHAPDALIESEVETGNVPLTRAQLRDERSDE